MNGTNLLLVSSNSQYCQEARNFFAQSNYNLTIAEDQLTALSLIEQTSFAIVICQLRASYIDGFAVLKRLQADEETAKIPFILLGKNFYSQEHRQAMEMGADDILFLPYSFLDIEGVVSARLNKNQALLEASQKELEQLRYSIATFLPHEIRTALTGIIAASELLFKKHKSLDTLIVREMLDCIHVSGKKLSHLTHNFLLYSELKSLASDEIKIANLRKESTVNVEKEIASIVNRYGQKYDRQSDITLDLENASVQIALVNFTKLVSELIDNACKFSAVGTPIAIASYLEMDRYVLKISNSGRGMTPQQIAQIGLGAQFERSVYEQQGFGLGLAIAKDLVELHEGNFTVDSIVNGQTNITIALPLAKKQLEEVATRNSKLQTSA